MIKVTKYDDKKPKTTFEGAKDFVVDLDRPLDIGENPKIKTKKEKKAKKGGK